MRSALPFVSFCILLFASCQKHERRTQSTYTFTNTNNKPVTLDVYGSKEDYAGNNNRIAQYSLAPGEVKPIQFEALKTVWIDWYSAGYSANNWAIVSTGSGSSAGIRLSAEMPIALEDDRVTLGSYSGDTSRSVLINGSGTSSTWEMYVPQSSYTSVPGTHRFVFRKDFTGVHTYTNPGGATTTSPMVYEVNSSGYSFNNNAAPPFDLYIWDGQASYNSSSPNFQLALINPNGTGYSHISRDSMYATQFGFNNAYGITAVRK